jgi:hypothetical protein
MDEAVVKVDRMDQSRGPKLSGKPRAIEESPYFDGKSMVVDLRTAILGGAVSARRFHDVVEFL